MAVPQWGTSNVMLAAIGPGIDRWQPQPVILERTYLQGQLVKSL